MAPGAPIAGRCVCGAPRSREGGGAWRRAPGRLDQAPALPAEREVRADRAPARARLAGDHPHT
jgi:hypothetical protein